MPNWTPFENAALLLSGLQAFEDKAEQDGNALERRIGQLFPSWMGRLAKDEEYKKYKCHFDEKPNGQGGLWTIESLSLARVAAGNLFRRCKDPVLKYVVNVCQVRCLLGRLKKMLWLM